MSRTMFVSFPGAATAIGLVESSRSIPPQGAMWFALPTARYSPIMSCASGIANHMAPWGGIDLLLSTNPIAVAVPGHEGPIVLDMATSVAAYGKVKTAAQLGRTMPEGWMF